MCHFVNSPPPAGCERTPFAIKGTLTYTAVFIKILEFKGLSVFSLSVLTRVSPFPPRVLTLFVFIVWLGRDLGLWL